MRQGQQEGKGKNCLVKVKEHANKLRHQHRSGVAHDGRQTKPRRGFISHDAWQLPRQLVQQTRFTSCKTKRNITSALATPSCIGDLHYELNVERSGVQVRAKTGYDYLQSLFHGFAFRAQEIRSRFHVSARLRFPQGSFAAHESKGGMEGLEGWTSASSRGHEACSFWPARSMFVQPPERLGLP